MQGMHAAVAELTVVDAHFPATQSMQSLLLEAGDVVEYLPAPHPMQPLTSLTPVVDV
jgi:hypothetical protein